VGRSSSRTRKLTREKGGKGEVAMEIDSIHFFITGAGKQRRRKGKTVHWSMRGLATNLQ